MTARCALHYIGLWVPWKFWVPDYAHGYFSQNSCSLFSSYTVPKS